MVRLLALLAIAALLLPGCLPADNAPPADDTGGTDTGTDGNDPGPADGDDTGSPTGGNDDSQAERALNALSSSTWFVVGYSSSSSFTGTAFAVGTDRFATTASIVRSIQQVQSETSPHTFIFQNETGARRTIVQAWLHPDSSADAADLSTPDVALFRAQAESGGEDPFQPLAIAEDDVLQGLRELDTFIVCGFPPTVSLGIDLTNVILGDGDFHPRATTLKGALSALRPLDPAEPATPENTQLLQCVIPRVNGMAGSPMVASDGALLGLYVAAAGTGEDIHFGLRADALAELIRRVDAGEVADVLAPAP